MDRTEELTQELLRAIKESDMYRDFKNSQERIMADPELFERVNHYRANNYNMQQDPARDHFTLVDQVSQAGNQKGSSRDSVVFLYSAEPEGTKVSAIYEDGEEIESKSVLPLLTVEAEYLTIGKTGVVFHAPGMDPAVRCALDENGMPNGDMEDSGSGRNSYYSYYFPLSEKPTFRFTPQDLDRTEISSITIGMEQWYLNDLRCYVLNPITRKWEEFSINKPLHRPETYLDRDGNLYCQFRSISGETYMDIPAPTLTLEGRVKDAET